MEYWDSLPDEEKPKIDKELKRLDVEDIKNIKNDLKCSDTVKDLEALGFVTITVENGEEWINITKKGYDYGIGLVKKTEERKINGKEKEDENFMDEFLGSFKRRSFRL